MADPVSGGNSTNNGTMTLDGSLSATYLYLDNGSVTLQPGSGNTGTLTLSDNANNIIQSGNGNWTFTNGPNHTIQGAGYIGVGTMGIVNQGTITANGKNPLIIQPNGNNFVNEATGILQATNGATLQLYGSSFDNSKGGVIRAVNGSTLELNNVYITGPLTRIAGLSSGTHTIQPSTTLPSRMGLPSRPRRRYDPCPGHHHQQRHHDA